MRGSATSVRFQIEMKDVCLQQSVMTRNNDGGSSGERLRHNRLNCFEAVLAVSSFHIQAQVAETKLVLEKLYNQYPHIDSRCRTIL